MRELWAMTWHEDREISPGVPDLHYVMVKPDPNERYDYQVGWLELKAKEKEITKSNRVSVEPSQHQYLRRWASIMPIHFLVRIVDRVYVIPGKYHVELAAAGCMSDIAVLSVHQFYYKEIADELAPFLRKITRISK